jgi:Fic family protein
LPEPWNEDPPGSQATISANIAALWPSIADDAATRPTPTIARAQEWHRSIYRGIALPVPYYSGEIRDSDPRFPELYGYEVSVGGRLGVISAHVPDELEMLEQRLQKVCRRLDSAIPTEEKPASEADLRAVIVFCANAHGEWVRIHPFANGNGRVARVWANWLALRYGLPPFVRIKPRPEGAGYETAVAASMRSEHSLTTIVFRGLLDEALGIRPDRGAR